MDSSMIEYIYRTKSFDRQLDRLRKSDKKGLLAARQVEKIIEVLSSCSDPFQELKRKQTKYGELRLSNCRKYHLGSGYRLITVWDERCVILTFVGSHDECHLWLEKHKDTALDTFSPKADRALPPVTSFSPELNESPPQSSTVFETDSYEEDLLQRIDEKTLRYVFRGLCRST